MKNELDEKIVEIQENVEKRVIEIATKLRKQKQYTSQK